MRNQRPFFQARTWYHKGTRAHTHTHKWVLTKVDAGMSMPVKCWLAWRHQMVNTAMSQAYTPFGRENCRVSSVMNPS